MHIPKLTRMEKSISLGLLAALVFVCITAISQENSKQLTFENLNPIASDLQVNDEAKKEKSPNPHAAAIASAIVPGAGQIYNKKYWKAPLIWGVGFGFYAYIKNTRTLYLHYKEASHKYSEDKNTFGVDKDHLVYYRTKFRRNMDRAVIYAGIFYFANIVDALVDAYLFDFDITEDLALHWGPKIRPDYLTNTNYTLSYGLDVQLRF